MKDYDVWAKPKSVPLLKLIWILCMADNGTPCMDYLPVYGRKLYHIDHNKVALYNNLRDRRN